MRTRPDLLLFAFSCGFVQCAAPRHVERETPRAVSTAGVEAPLPVANRALPVPSGALSVPSSALARASGSVAAIRQAPRELRDAGASAQQDAAAAKSQLGTAKSQLGTANVYVVAAVGDSLTDARAHGGGFLDFIQSRCPRIQIDNFGQGGFMVNQIRRRFESEVLTSSKAYTHLIVFGGVNDLYSDLTALRTPAKIESDLSRMYADAHAHGMRVVALTVAPWGGFRHFNASRGQATRALNSWILGQKSAGSIDVAVDSYALLSCGNAERLCDRHSAPFTDGLHFGPAGHAALGAAVYQAAFADCK